MIIFSRNISKTNDIILSLQIFQNEVNVKLDNNWKNFMRISFQETVLKCYVLSNVTPFGNSFLIKILYLRYGHISNFLVHLFNIQI